MPPPLQSGPGRWPPAGVHTPTWVQLLPCRPGAWEKPPVLGAEDWDFVGQLNRHPHLARKDPALSSPASPNSVAGASPTGFLGLDPATRFPRRSALPTLFSPSGVRPRRHPPRPKPAPEELHDVRRRGFQATAAQAEEQCWAWGCCGDPAFPVPAPPAESARVTRRETSPRSHAAPARPSPRGPAPRRLGYLRSDPRGGGRAAGGAPPTAGRALPLRRARVATAGGRGSSCGRTPRPDVPRAPGQGPGPRSTCRDPGAAAAPSPKSASPALRGEELGAETPRKLGEFRPLARTALASSTCW